jgi:hypothetical protein
MCHHVRHEVFQHDCDDRQPLTPVDRAVVGPAECERAVTCPRWLYRTLMTHKSHLQATRSLNVILSLSRARSKSKLNGFRTAE